jgi:drug/metabolite transporter (DMT)-like permease
MNHATTPNSDRIGFAILMMLTATFLIALQEALIKFSSAELTVWQMFTLRGFLTTPLFLAMAWPTRQIGATWRGAFYKWPLARAGCMTAMLISVYTGIPFTPLATIVAGVYTAPIFVALIAAWFMDEPVGWRGWIGVVLGFLGVLLIVQPNSDSFTYFTILPILGGVFYALQAIITRTKCRHDPPLSLSLSLTIFTLVLGLVGSVIVAFVNPATEFTFLTNAWFEMTPRVWMIITALSILMAVIGIVMPMAYQNGPATIIATFDYCFLIWAIILGIIMFGDYPNIPSIVGMALIVAAGLLITRK